MKRLLFISLLVAAAVSSYAQNDSANNYVKGFMTLPSFQVRVLPDSSLYTNAKLEKNWPVMIMFFSPDCDHCQHQVKEMLAYKNELKDIQVVMISVLPYKDNKGFYEEYGLATEALPVQRATGWRTASLWQTVRPDAPKMQKRDHAALPQGIRKPRNMQGLRSGSFP